MKKIKKLHKGDKLILGLGKLYKKQFVTFDLFLCLKILCEMHPEMGFTRTRIKRLVEEGGVSVFYKTDEII